MAPVDIAILGIVGISCLLGLWRGLVKEALSLAAWVGAVVTAGLFNAQAGQLLAGVISSPALQKVAGGMLIFVAVVFVGGLIGNLISKLFSAVGLGAADRALGGLFGIVRGAVIVIVIVTFTARFSFTQPHYSQSLAMPYLMVVANKLQDLFGWAPATAEAERALEIPMANKG
jgi:membrane protein required for colicin V production